MFALMLLSLSPSNLESKHSSYSDPTTDSEPLLTFGSFGGHHGGGSVAGFSVSCAHGLLLARSSLAVDVPSLTKNSGVLSQFVI